MSIKLFGRGVFLGRAGIHGNSPKLERLVLGRGVRIEGNGRRGEWLNGRGGEDLNVLMILGSRAQY